MAIKILMPALSPTMEEGNLAKWLKKEGDKIEPGMLLAEIETDKAIMEVEAVDSGIIGKIIIPEGTKNVKVNQLIAVLLEEGEDKSSIEEIMSQETSSIDSKDSSTTNKPEAEIVKTEDTNVTSQESTTTPNTDSVTLQNSENNRIFASPLAKRIAKENAIDINQVSGTGPRGRVIKNDVMNFLKGDHSNNHATSNQINVGLQRNPQETSIIQVSNIRNVIAKKLLESKQTIPHFYLEVDCNLDKLMQIRKDINDAAPTNDSGKPNYKVSVNDFIVQASAKALADFPEINSSWSDNGIIRYNNVVISIAVAIDDGLITPVVKNADLKPIIAISNEIKSLVIKAKEMKLKPEEFQGGGFSISNLGMYNINSFNAIINPPQSSILAVGAGIKKPIVKGDEIKAATIMNVTLSCDHRVIDGALGALFLNKFKEYIENPLLSLI